jgi:hypothetical protein
MIAASARVGFALGVPLEPDILGSPLYSLPRYHSSRKAEHLGLSIALFKKGCAVLVAIQRLYDARRQIFADLHIFGDSLAQATNGLERKKGFRRSHLSPLHLSPVAFWGPVKGSVTSG